MLRMNTNNGFWSYFWSAFTGFFAMLTLQDVLFAAGAVVTSYFTWLTYRSNNRRNKTIEEEERKRTAILQAAYTRGDVSEIKLAAKALNEIDSIMQPQQD